MPKIKTRKTLLKRIRITKNGKVMKKSSQNGHLKVKSDSSMKSRKKKPSQMKGIGNIKTLKKLLAKRGKGLRV